MNKHKTFLDHERTDHDTDETHFDYLKRLYNTACYMIIISYRVKHDFTNCNVMSLVVIINDIDNVYQKISFSFI